jgi:hypothetical protein
VLKNTQSYVTGVQSWKLEAVDFETDIRCASLIVARIDFLHSTLLLPSFARHVQGTRSHSV